MDPRVKHEGDGVWGDGPSCRGTRVTLKKESTRVTVYGVVDHRVKHEGDGVWGGGPSCQARG